MHALRRTAVVVLTSWPPCSLAAPGQAAGGTAKAQRRLNTLGCDAGPVDGRTGTWTRAAVVRFQAANRLRPDRLAGPRPPAPGCTATAPVRCDRPAGPGAAAADAGSWSASARTTSGWCAPSGRVVAQGGVVDNPRYLRAGHLPGRLEVRAGRADPRQQRRQRTTAAARLHAVRAVRHRLPPDPAVPLHRRPDPLRPPARHEPARVARLHPGQPGDVPADLGLRVGRHEGRRASADPDGRSLRDVVERRPGSGRCARPGPAR